MLHMFYRTRNIAGLILAISPLLPIPAAGRSLSFYLYFLTASAFSMPLLSIGLRWLPFRLWLFFCGFCGAVSLCLLFTSVSGALLLPAAVMAGITFSGLVLLLPPYISVGWFRRSKTYILSLVWSFSLLAGIAWYQGLTLRPDAALVLAALSMASGLFFFLEQPPAGSVHENPLISGRPSAFTRPSLYTASIAASLGLLYSLVLLQTNGTGSSAVSIQMTSASALVPLLLLPAAPLAAGFLIDRKGIYSSCIFLMFLCEGAALCLGSLDGWFFHMLGYGLLTASAGSLPVILPVLTFYLYGHLGFQESFSRLAVFLPAGLLTGLPFCSMAVNHTITAEETVIFLLFLLVLSFFCIFFAWKKRFIILKNKII